MAVLVRHACLFVSDVIETFGYLSSDGLWKSRGNTVVVMGNCNLSVYDCAND